MSSKRKRHSVFKRVEKFLADDCMSGSWSGISANGDCKPIKPSKAFVRRYVEAHMRILMRGAK